MKEGQSITGSTMAQEVKEIVIQGATNTVLKVHSVLKYFSKLTEKVLVVLQTTAKEETCDIVQNQGEKTLINTKVMSKLLLNDTEVQTVTNSKIKQADSTTDNNEIKDVTNAEEIINTVVLQQNDNGIKDDIHILKANEIITTQEKKKEEIKDDTTESIETELQEKSDKELLQTTEESKNKDTVKHWKEDQQSKYASPNYYSVLAEDFKGDFFEFQPYLEKRREYQIQYPIDINPKKNYNQIVKKVEKKKTKMEIKKETKPTTNTHRKTVTAQYFKNQTAYEYTERVKKNLIVSNMSFLKKRTTVLPELETPIVKSVIENGNSAKQFPPTEEWTTVGTKGAEFSFEDIFALTSTKFLPKHLPPGPVNTDTTVNDTNYEFPLMIKVNKLKNQKQQLNNTRIVVAVLAAIQKICKETYLIPREGTGNLPPIKSPTQVSMNPNELKCYMELPPEEQRNKYSMVARINIKTNVKLSDCKAHPKFVEYLVKEHLVLDINGLIDVAPEHVGYLEKVDGRHETLDAHTERIKELLGEGAPIFQLNIHTLKSYDGRCKVFMMNCDQSNLESLRKKMHNLHAQKLVRFMSWREFTGMEDVLHRVAVRKELDYAKEYESLLITGFVDNEDNITMKMPDPDDLQISFDIDEEGKLKKCDPMENTYVSDFIGQVKSGTGENLFKHVYAPYKGTCEVLVKKKDSSVAKEYIKVIKGELAKHMNEVAIDMVFEDPVAVRALKNTSTWQPYSRAAELLEECKQNNILLNPAKRVKKNEPSNDNTNKNRYVQSTTQNNNSSNKPNNGSNNQNHNAVNNNNNNNDDNSNNDTNENENECDTHMNGNTNQNNNNMNDILVGTRENNNNKIDIVEHQLNDQIDTILTNLTTQEQEDIISILVNDIKWDTLEEKQQDQLRIFFQNINSLRPNNTDKWEATIKQLFEFKADIVGFCETCCNWKKTALKKLFQIKANRILKNPMITTTTTTLNYEENYLPGGCCQITTNSWTTRSESKIYDDFRLGRWIGNSYRVSPTKKLLVVTAYRVCELNLKATNSLSTATHQHTMLLARGIDNPQPRKQFIEDFIIQFQPFCDDIDNYFMLSLDANSTVGHDKEGIDKLMTEYNLVDVYTTLHQDYSQFPTQQRGSKKIDFMLCTRNLIPYISKCGYVQFNDGFDSDHRGISEIFHTPFFEMIIPLIVNKNAS
jgi:hypothetical protein